jgi:hypothetical protein
MEVGNLMWNTFCYLNFFQISMDFELIQIFRFKFELPDICSLWLIGTPIANPPEINFGYEVLHGDLQSLNYDLIYMNKLTPKIEEVMEFQI